ncbi:unnamed protein product [Somion occarium]
MCHDISQVFVPLIELGVCPACSTKRAKYRCIKCGERAYCSKECQVQEWPKHKLECGKTERIDLEQFYPALAWMYSLGRLPGGRPMQVALQHKIINDPNANTPPTRLQDGIEAKVVEIDDTHPPSIFLDSLTWFPRAANENVADTMHRRVLNDEGSHLLTSVAAVATAILVEIYTTSSGSGSKSSNERRLRFKYRSSPIVDFGIATGSLEVKPQDRIA